MDGIEGSLSFVYLFIAATLTKGGNDYINSCFISRFSMPPDFPCFPKKILLVVFLYNNQTIFLMLMLSLHSMNS